MAGRNKMRQMEAFRERGHQKAGEKGVMGKENGDLLSSIIKQYAVPDRCRLAK